MRCPDCDRDGEVQDKRGGWIKCPRCDGTRKIKNEEQPNMNEETLYRWLMITAAVISVVCAAGAVSLVVVSALSFSIGALTCALLMTGGSIGAGYFTTYFADKSTTPKVFNNLDEKEVLNNKQRRELREARGKVVMERAMIEVEHERQNIVHNLELEAGDDTKPPHQTRWSDEVTNMLNRRRDN